MNEIGAAPPPSPGSSSAAEWRLTGRHVLACLIGFFAVVIAVNGVFMHFAVSSFSGVETVDAYRKGLAYNQRLAEIAREADVGWRGKVGIEQGRPVLMLLDKLGQPVLGALVDGKIGRPSVDRYDRPMTFSAVGQGRYRADAAALEPGAWMLTLAVRPGNDARGAPVLRLKERLWLPR